MEEKKEVGIYQMALDSTVLCISNAIMMVNLYGKKKRSLDSVINLWKWKRKLKYWKKRKVEIEKLIENQ